MSRPAPQWMVETRAPINARFAIAGGAVVMPGLADDGAVVLDGVALDDGAPRWQVALDYFSLTGVVSGVQVGAGGETVYLAQDTTVAAFAADGGVRRWQVRVPAAEPFEDFSIGHTPIAAGELVYLLSRWSRVVAIDRRDGALAFRTDDHEPAGELALRDGAVITSSPETHDLRAHDPRTGAPLWQRALRAPPPITERLATSIRLAPRGAAHLIADGDRVLALDARTGVLRWAKPATGRVSYAFAGATAVVADDGAVRGLDAATGAIRWRHPTGGRALVAPLDEAGVLVARPGSLWTLAAADGALREHRGHPLHEQDRVLDAGGGLAAITTDGGVARLYRRDGAALVETTIGEVAPRPGERATDGVVQAVVAAGGAVTFDTAHRLARFTPRTS